MKIFALAAATLLLGCGSIAPDAGSSTEGPHELADAGADVDAIATDAPADASTGSLDLYSMGGVGYVDITASPATPAFDEWGVMLGGPRGTSVTLDAVLTLDDPRIGSFAAADPTTRTVEFRSATSFPWLSPEGVGYAQTILRATADGATGAAHLGVAAIRQHGEQQDFILPSEYAGSDSPLATPFPQTLFASVDAPTTDVTFSLSNDPSNPPNPDGSFVDATKLVSVVALPDPGIAGMDGSCFAHDAIDTNGDGALDTFPGAVKNKVCFRVSGVENAIAPGYSDGTGEGFVVWVDVFGAGGAVRLDHRAVIVLAYTFHRKTG